MPPKKICSDRAPLNRREWSVTNCYKRGISSGFIAGIKKSEKDSLNKAKIKRPLIEATAQAIILSKFKSVKVEDVTNDFRKAYLSILKYPRYRALPENETIRILKARGINRVFIPRV